MESGVGGSDVRGSSGSMPLWPAMWWMTSCVLARTVWGTSSSSSGSVGVFASRISGVVEDCGRVASAAVSIGVLTSGISGVEIGGVAALESVGVLASIGGVGVPIVTSKASLSPSSELHIPLQSFAW